MDDTIKLLDDFVMREPAYAPAWAELAVAHNEKLVANRDLVSGAVAEALPFIRNEIAKRDAAADQARKLDSGNAQALCVSAQSLRDRRDTAAGMELWQRAIALDSDEPDCLETYGLWLARIGFPDKGLEVMNHLIAVEPLLPSLRGTLADVLAMAGQTEAARSIMNQYLPGYTAPLAIAYADQGQFQHAADLLAATKPPNETPAEKKAVAEAARLLRAAPAPAPRDAPELGQYDWVYVYTGAPERMMGTFEDHLRAGFLGGTYSSMPWYPRNASVLKTNRFKAWIRTSGILAYWRAKGWPSRCHPTTGDDFECN